MMPCFWAVLLGAASLPPRCSLGMHWTLKVYRWNSADTRLDWLYQAAPSWECVSLCGWMSEEILISPGQRNPKSSRVMVARFLKIFHQNWTTLEVWIQNRIWAEQTFVSTGLVQRFQYKKHHAGFLRVCYTFLQQLFEGSRRCFHSKLYQKHKNKKRTTSMLCCLVLNSLCINMHPLGWDFNMAGNVCKLEVTCSVWFSVSSPIVVVVFHILYYIYALWQIGCHACFSSP